MEKTTLLLKGLDCPHCTEKIGDRVKKLDSVADSEINFISKKLTYTPLADSALDDIKAIVKEIEPDVVVTELNSKQKTYILNGLDCPNCAEKIADRINKLDSVSDAKVNFINKKLTYTELDASAFGSIEKIVHELEPDVEIKPLESASKSDDDDDEEEATLFDLFRLIAALAIFGLSFIPFFDKTIFNIGTLGVSISNILIIIAYVVSGYDVIINCVRNIIKLHPFDECFLMTVATVGAFALGDFSEAAAVMIFYQIGELFQSYAVGKSRKSVTGLLAMRPDKVNVKRGDEIVTVSPEEVGVSDIIVLKAGERAPLDCKLLGSGADFDMSALTGESVPVSVYEDGEVLAGSINLSKTVELEVIRPFAESAMSRILDMVENASSKKAKTERFITKFAKVYTPIVVFSALALFLIPSLFAGFSTSAMATWGYRALLFLVVSCPCALVVSVPLGFFAGIGGASRKGVLIKGANNIEIMANVKQIAFDKTGTLTSGSFTVAGVNSADGNDDEVLKLCALAEMNSNHPIAKSIVKAADQKFGRLDKSEIQSSEEISGRGIKSVIGLKTVLAGNTTLLSENGITVPDSAEGKTCVYVAADGKYLGFVVLEDEIKKNAVSLMSKLSRAGIKSIMLTGDGKQAAENVAEKIGVCDYRAELLPENKVECIEQMLSSGTTAFAGDGINDAPVLARADIGISMGAMGSDIAIETADAIIMNDDIGKIMTMINVSRKTMRIVKSNIIFALAVKALVLIFGALGLVGMWAAVFADVGVALICVLNSLRALRCKED